MADTDANAGPTSGRQAATRDDPVARKMKLDALKERIARADYAVDPNVVAEALIRRVDVTRMLAPSAVVSRRGARIHGLRAHRRPR
jgi:hypothetical protein